MLDSGGDLEWFIDVFKGRNEMQISLMWTSEPLPPLLPSSSSSSTFASSQNTFECIVVWVNLYIYPCPTLEDRPWRERSIVLRLFISWSRSACYVLNIFIYKTSISFALKTNLDVPHHCVTRNLQCVLV